MFSNYKNNPTTHLYHMAAVALLLFISILTYSNSFNGVFSFDDEYNILDNNYLKITEINYTSLQKAASLSPSRHRWLPNISFALNYYFHGHQRSGYHLVNITIHIMAAVILYFLSFTTLTLPNVGIKPKHAAEISLIAAMIWAVHPLQTNAVTYIVQRMTSMAALFYLASLLCYVRGRLSFMEIRSCRAPLAGYKLREDDDTDTSTAAIRPYLWWAGSLICGLAAMLSKENSAMLVLIILAYEFYFLKDETVAINYKKIIPALIITFSGLFFAGWLYLGNNPLTNVIHGFGGRDFTLVERLLTEARVIFHYLSLIILPLPSRLNLNYDYQISHSLLAPPQTIIAVLGIIGLLYLTAYLFKRHKLLSFGLFWFLVNLAIESTIIALELIYEHRLYLPSTMLILAGVFTIYQLWTKQAQALRISFSILIVVLCLFTWQRNQVWGNEINLWHDVVKKSPNLARGHINLGRALEAAGKHKQARRALLKGIDLEPDAGMAWLNLGRTYEMEGLFYEAMRAYKIGLTKKNVPRDKIHNNIAAVHIRLNNLGSALEETSLALRVNPRMVDAWLNRGVAYGRQGLHQEAEKAIRRGIALAPRDGRGLFRLAAALEHQNRLPEAINALNQALTKEYVDRRAVRDYRRELLTKMTVR